MNRRRLELTSVPCGGTVNRRTFQGVAVQVDIGRIYKAPPPHPPIHAILHEEDCELFVRIRSRITNLIRSEQYLSGTLFLKPASTRIPSPHSRRRSMSDDYRTRTRTRTRTRKYQLGARPLTCIPIISTESDLLVL